MPADNARAERPFSAVLMGIWRGRVIVVACIAMSMVVGYFRQQYSVPIYSSSSTIEILPPSQIINDPIAQQVQSSSYLYTQIQIIHSTALLTEALKQPGIPNADCLKNFTTDDGKIAYLKNAVIVGPDKQSSDLLYVEMQAPNPVDAANIVNGVVEAYQESLKKSRTETADEMTQILGNTIDAQQAELRQEQQAVTDFKKENPQLVLQYEQGTASSSPMETELQRANLIMANLQIARDEALRHSNDPDFLKVLAEATAGKTEIPLQVQPVVDPSVDLEYHRVCEELLVDSGEARGLRVPQLEKQKLQLESEFRRQRDAATERYMAFLNKQTDSAQKRVAALQAKVDDQQSRINDQYAKMADYKQLLQKSENTQLALNALYSQRKAVNVTSVGLRNAHVLEPARVSNEAVGAGKTYRLMMSLVIGLMTGLGASLLREMFEQRLRSVDEISRLLSPPVLGSVPHIIGKPPKLLPNLMRAPGTPWSKYLRSGAGVRNRREWTSSQSLMQRGQAMHLQPRSDIAEAYRAIRTSIYYGLRGHPAKTILVTSPSSGDGKTTLASNLAIAIAQAGRRVLLIDADCWHPSQHEIFALGAGQGLTAILRKKSTLADLVRKTDVENLEILPCGDVPANPAELLDSQQLLDLLAEASSKYDQVLIDSPPVVPITDARILAASCGATILVLRAGKSTRKSADAAFAVLTAVGAPILGMVVNDVARQSISRSHGYYRYVPANTPLREDWNQYEPTTDGNGHQGGGHASAAAQNGKGQIVHYPVEIIDPEDAADHERG